MKTTLKKAIKIKTPISNSSTSFDSLQKSRKEKACTCCNPIEKHDHHFNALVADASKNMAAAPLFLSDVTNTWDLYLKSLPPSQRQHHTCNACKSFFDRFGGLVHVMPVTGEVISALWSDLNPAKYGIYGKSIKKLQEAFATAKVSDFFISTDSKLGQPHTNGWGHIFVHNPYVTKLTTQTADQRTAELREDLLLITTLLDNTGTGTMKKAKLLMKSPQMYQAKTIEPQLIWLQDSVQAYLDNDYRLQGHNLVYLITATAPKGFAHIKNGILGSLLESILEGDSDTTCIRKFNEKMDPLKYQRPTTVAEGTLDKAEKRIDDLGLDLRRRAAHHDDLRYVWTPRMAKKVKPAVERSVFGGIKANKGVAKSINYSGFDIITGTQRMSFVRFFNEILSDVLKLQIKIPYSLRPCQFTTAVDPDAEPLMKHDRKDDRYPVTQFFNMSEVSRGALGLNALENVHGITGKPSDCMTDNAFNEYAVFVTENGKVTRSGGSALFPVAMRGDLHDVRSAIEAYSNANELEPSGGADALGIKFGKEPNQGPVELIAYMKDKTTQNIRIELWS